MACDQHGLGPIGVYKYLLKLIQGYKFVYQYENLSVPICYMVEVHYRFFLPYSTSAWQHFFIF